MVYKKFVELGRVVFIALGPHQGKIAGIVDVVDQNRLLIAGPLSDVPCHVINIKHIQLTKFRAPVISKCKDVQGCIKRWWKKNDINSKWNESTWAKNLTLKARKASLTDFERFSARMLKQKRNRIIRKEMVKLKGITKARKLSILKVIRRRYKKKSKPAKSAATKSA